MNCSLDNNDEGIYAVTVSERTDTETFWDLSPLFIWYFMDASPYMVILRIGR